MPDPDDWYKKPHAKEIIYPLFDQSIFELRIRVRFLTKQVGKSKKKDIDTFSVGLEIKVRENLEWDVIVRHCNSHTDNVEEFHTNNEHSLVIVGQEEKIIRRLAKKKIPASQMRWAIKDIRSNYITYKKYYLKKKGLL